MGFPASRMAIRSPKGEMTLTSAESLEQVGGSAQSNVQEERIERFGEKYRKIQHCRVEQKTSQIVNILLFHHSLVPE